MPSSAPRIAFIIAPQQFRDEELTVPRQYLQSQGWQCTTYSTQAGVAQGMLGAQEAVTLTLADVDVTAVEAVAIVGGYGAVEHLWGNTTLHALCQQAVAQGKVLGAICVSPVALAKAGVLAGKRASVWPMPESHAAFEAAGAVLSDEAVTTDGLIVTANGPEAALAFAHHVAHALQAAVAQNSPCPQ